MHHQSETGRKSIRLRHYDYATTGAYFVTVVTQDRVCLFGDIVADAMVMNEAGTMVADTWFALADRFPTLVLDAFVVMPNHMHGVLILSEGDAGDGPDASTGVGVGQAPAGRDKPCPYNGKSNSKPMLGDVIGAFKSITTHRYTRGVRERGWASFSGRLWQRNYYEHVIRSEDRLADMRRYIDENPLRWALDEENPRRQAGVPSSRR